MSNANQETIADIVADIRAQNQGLPEDSYALSPLVCDLLSFADRIEAAHQRDVAELKSKMNDVVCENEALRDACGTCGAKREREATREKSSRVGNAAKMRDGLRQVSRVAVEMTRKTVTGESEDRKTVDEWALRLCDIVSSTLAAPPRNCDRPECATTKSAQDVWRKEDGGKTAYYEWLLQKYEEGESEVEG